MNFKASLLKILLSTKSWDFRGLKMADTCQNPSIQVRLSMIFPLILARFAWGLKQIPQNNETKCPSWRLSDKDRVKKSLTSNRLLVNNFLTRSFYKSQISCHHFPKVSASNPMQIWPALTEISKKVLPESTVFQWYPPLLLFWSQVILHRVSQIHVWTSPTGG